MRPLIHSIISQMTNCFNNIFICCGIQMNTKYADKIRKDMNRIDKLSKDKKREKSS